jgi:hypothetical protein
MRLPAFVESHEPLPDALDDAPSRGREAQIEAMFPDICLPSFVAIASRRPRHFDARGHGRRSERESRDR